MKKNKILEFAKKIVDKEINALYLLKDKAIDKNFIKAIDIILKSNGKVILSGVGKSGIIAKKISSMLSSIGTQSFFIHPVEAMHGDLGIINENDIVILLSNSGDTAEINKIASILKKRKIKMIAITNNPKSKLSILSDVTLNLHINKQADPHNIVPTSSTTAMLVMGDAIALTLMQIKGYDKEKFALNHPGGNLGKLLYIKVGEIMRKGKENPVIELNATIEHAIKVMTKSSLGAVSIVDKNGNLCGFFTDGDLRRKFSNINLKDKIFLHMTKNPISIQDDELAINAAKIMQDKKIDNLPVVDKRRKVVGIIDERDLIREGII